MPRLKLDGHARTSLWPKGEGTGWDLTCQCGWTTTASSARKVNAAWTEHREAVQKAARKKSHEAR